LEALYFGISQFNPKHGSTNALYATVAGLAVLASGVVMLALLTMRKVGAQRTSGSSGDESASMKRAKPLTPSE
jgi:hypothetical protein